MGQTQAEMNNFLSWISLKRSTFLSILLISPPQTVKSPLVERNLIIFLPSPEILRLRNMTPTRTPTRHASLSVNTSSLPSIMEFSIPSEFTVPSAQGPTIPENVDVIIRELQPIAIEQQPMVLGEERVLAKY